MSQQIKWLYLIVLSLIWGSSFILMKKSLISLTGIEIGALRILFTAIVLAIIGGHSLKKIRRRHWKYLVLNSVLGNFFPPFLFAIAISKIDSSIAAVLNSLTPINTLIVGFFVFGFAFYKRQVFGLIIGLLGALYLILEGSTIHPEQNYWYALLIIISSVGHAFNVNIIKKHLSDLSSLAITTSNFLIIFIPAGIVLLNTDFINSFSGSEEQMQSIFYVLILSVLCTAIAKILFNKLIQISTPIFSSSVTYLIPLVALTFGILDGEQITLSQFIAGGVILLGVYLTNLGARKSI